MGVQHLWSILETSKLEESVNELRYKTLCIDLSLWICEAQRAKGLKEQLKPYLRNVFFRTLYLTSLGVRPVFVVDGIPPEIKRETIVRRLQERRGHLATDGQKQKKLSRSRFTMMSNECCEMMRLLGIPFVKSDGEAEATCAWLNENSFFSESVRSSMENFKSQRLPRLKMPVIVRCAQGVVNDEFTDGVLTDDSDVFLYGAKVVYKGFNVSSSKKQTDDLQVFKLEKIQHDLGLTRRNMIGLALLLGCDYLPSGVPGVGKETAIRLLSSLPGVDLLNRFSDWRSSPDICFPDLSSLEIAIKRKAVKDPDFPSKAVIKEFLTPSVGKTSVNLKWTRPDLEGIKEFFFRKLEWPKEYTEEKMLFLVTDWQLVHMDLAQDAMFFPSRIVKPRVKQGKEFYEIEWKTKSETSKWPTTFANTKIKEIVCEKFPTLVAKFEIKQAAKKNKGKTRKRQENKAISNEENDLDNLLAKIDSIDLNEENSKTHCDDECHDQLEIGDAKGNEGYADLACAISDEITNFGVVDGAPKNHVLAATSHEKAPIFVVDSPCTLPNLPSSACNVQTSTENCSPAVNGGTLPNLVDITINEEFGSNLDAIDDLLTDSFIASLENDTPKNNSRCAGIQSFQSPMPMLFHRKIDHVSFQSNATSDEDVSTFDDKIFADVDPNREPDKFYAKEFSDEIHGIDNSTCVFKGAKTKGFVNTPYSGERNYLALRLLERFGREGQTSMADKLRSISSESEVVSGMKTDKRSELLGGKRNKKFAKHEPFVDISNLPWEMKSSKAKPNDVVVID